MRLLVVVAHPDDEAFGCGATLARLSDEGHEVRVLMPLRRCDPRGVRRWDALVRAFVSSCEHLGAEPVVPADLIAEVKAESHTHEVHDAIVEHVAWADTVFTHYTGDCNQVHRGVARAVEVATRPFRRRRAVYLFEVPTSTDQGFAAAFAPTAYAVVGAPQVDRKCEAAELYAEDAPGRTATDLRNRLALRGAEVGAEFAEAFVVARSFL